MTESAASPGKDAALSRDLNVWHASALVVGIIIGSGIFLVPKSMMANAGTVGLVFAAWIVGGLLSWFGSLGFAELAAMRPSSGGEYVYIRDGYGPMAGFLHAWNTFLIAKPASIATVAMGVVRILGEFPIFQFLQVEVVHGPLPLHYGQIVAAGVILLFTYLNYIGVRRAGNFQLLMTTLKVVMILAIIGIGFSYTQGGLHNFRTTYPAAPGGMAGFMAALIAALWAYDGWNNVVMVAGEIKEPQRSIPRALIFGITVVGLLYMLTFAAVQWVVPASEIATAERPASLAIQYAIGPAGAMVISAGIAFSMFVTINGQILTGARVPFAAAADGYFFASIAAVHPRYHTPGNALLLQGGLTILLIFVGGAFEDLFNLAIFSEWLFYVLATSTLFLFRHREPEAPRPYKTFGYPVVPTLFLLAAGFLLYYSFMQNLRNSVAGSLVILAGIPVFLFFRNRMAKRCRVLP
jgi:APA family basic amino acid/polyamine antiporter